jgi:hypothetical protein
MLTLVGMAVLVSGLYTFADLGAKSVRNRERATRAVHVAEAGINHALGLMRGNLRMHSFTRILRGFDNVVPSADDSLFIGWGLTAGDEIPLAGQIYQGHTYFVTVRDDPADGDVDPATDLNGRVRLRCRAETTEGATAEVEAIIGAVPMPAMAADGNVAFSGSPDILGACGGAHANGNIHASGGGPIIGTQVTATGTASGSWNSPGGGAAPSLSGQPEIPIPDLNPMDFCAGAEFTLTSTGGILNTLTGITSPAPSDGWSYNAGTNTWTLTGGATVPTAGTYCAQGNVWVQGSTGSAANPKSLSILATKSVRIEGTPYLKADHDDGILVMAGGDVYLAGNPAAGSISYQGMAYAGAQCSAQGQATMIGQLLCANGPQPLGAIDWAPGNTVGGNFTLHFDCSANVFNKRRVLFWYPRIGA